MGTTWFVRGVVAAMLLLQPGCTLIFRFRATPDEKEEVRLPPPEQVPVFSDRRHEGAPGRRHRFGSALAAGHFTRDVSGPDVELAIGVPGANDSSGKVVRIVKTAAGQQVTDEILPGNFIVTEGKIRFGAALAAGDFDDDGFDDLAIGAPDHATTGAVALLYGGPVRRHVLVPANDPAGRRGFGSALATGDFDGDGFDDLVVGEPGTAGGGHAPRVWVFWGRPGQLALNDSTQILVPEGDEQDNTTLFGASLAVGNLVMRTDHSAPVRPDLAIGAPKFDHVAAGRGDVGRVYVFRPARDDPRDNPFVLAVTLEPGNGWELYAKEFGFSLAVGNFNDDAAGEPKDDLAIGAPHSSIPEHDGLDTTFGQPSGRAGKPGAGLVFLAPHRAAAVSAPLRVLSQDRMGLSQKGDHFGWALAAADFNRDGVADLAIGSPSERMSGLDLSGAQQAGAIYFRFGNAGDWDAAGNPGGIPQLPVECFDYIDAVRGAGAARKSDHFGAVLLPALFDDDDAVDLIVGAPDTDVDSAGGKVADAGAVWIGLNQETRPGPFDGTFVGLFRDDECGGAEAAEITMDIRNREGAVCGTLATSRRLCFQGGDDDERVFVEQIGVSVVAGNLEDSDSMHLEYIMRNDDGRNFGTLSIDADVAGADGDLTLDLRYVGRGDADGIKRSADNIVLERQ
jgi:hypothetical protein